MTKDEVLKILRHKRDDVCNLDEVPKETRLTFKIQKDTYDRCIKLIEQIE